MIQIEKKLFLIFIKQLKLSCNIEFKYIKQNISFETI